MEIKAAYQKARSILQKEGPDCVLKCVADFPAFWAFGFGSKNEGSGGGWIGISKDTGEKVLFNPVDDLESFIGAPKIDVFTVL